MPAICCLNISSASKTSSQCALDATTLILFAPSIFLKSINCFGVISYATNSILVGSTPACITLMTSYILEQSKCRPSLQKILRMLTLERAFMAQRIVQCIGASLAQNASLRLVIQCTRQLSSQTQTGVTLSTAESTFLRVSLLNDSQGVGLRV